MFGSIVAGADTMQPIRSHSHSIEHLLIKSKVSWSLIYSCPAFPLRIGSHINLTSHGYPGYYPPKAYALWKFQYTDDEDGYDPQTRLGYITVGSGVGNNDALHSLTLNRTDIYLFVPPKQREGLIQSPQRRIPSHPESYLKM